MSTQRLRIVTDEEAAAAAALAAAPAPAPAGPPSPPPAAAPGAPPALAPAASTLPPVPALAPEAQPGRAWSGRVFALGMLAVTVVGLGWLGVQVYHAVADSWIAPLHLSPQSDQVSHLRLQHQRHLAELARLDAEITRIDGELEAIDEAATRLTSLRGNEQATMRWQAEHRRVEATGLDTAIGLLRRQRALVVQLHARQETLVARARDDLAAGAIDRTGLDREVQILDQLALELTDLDRQLAEADVRRTHSRAALRALRAGTGDGHAPPVGRMPEVVVGEEHATRIELEIQRLQAEARGQRALRAVAVANVAAQRELLTELETRPLYRAMTAATDIAFVPYDQLAGVVPGARVLDCVWGLFACDQVGRVSELIPGEVVTQDPWGEMARGQYVILALDEAHAIRERVLRVRR